MKEPKFPNAIIKSKYQTWALARRGTQNPQDMTNPVWTWMMKGKIDPFSANKLLDKEHKHQPGWCYHRMGQTETILPDGTKVLIAGEHEDSYDPDFFIYNDVTLIRPDGEIVFYGYPEYWFPPTDNHSATLVEDKIFIIGCLGYPHQRHKNKTPVYCLNTDDFYIRKVPTTGASPSWLHRHDARLSEDGKAIICEGGKEIHVSGNYVDNLAVWHIELATGHWTKISEKNWKRWQIYREDGSMNELWDIGRLAWQQTSECTSATSKKFRKDVDERGHVIDLELYKNRHVPPVAYSSIEDDKDNFRPTRCKINGVDLRVEEDSYDIAFTVEGELPEDVIETLHSHYLDIYAKLEGKRYVIEIID